MLISMNLNIIYGKKRFAWNWQPIKYLDNVSLVHQRMYNFK